MIGVTQGKDRDWLSSTAADVSLYGGGARAILDTARIVKKYPEAHRAGRMRQAIVQTLKNQPDTRLIDPRAPEIATAASHGRSFTKWDKATYRASMGGHSVLAAIQFTSALPNLHEALSEDGPAGLVTTRSGRTGLINIIGGGTALAMTGWALVEARRGGTRGVTNLLVEAATSHRMSSPVVVNVIVGAGWLMTANEFGLMNALDKQQPA